MTSEDFNDQIKLLWGELLRTQRQLARFNMILQFNAFQELLRLHDLDRDYSLTNQMETDLKTEIMKLKTAPDPMSIAGTFSMEYGSKLEKLGLKVKKFPTI